MAWTFTEQASTLWGNMRVKIWKAAPDSGTVTALQTGLDNIIGHTVAILTATGTSTFGIPNKGAAGTAIGGTIAISSAAAGGDVMITVYGN
jgi:hypothetical protein